MICACTLCSIFLEFWLLVLGLWTCCKLFIHLYIINRMRLFLWLKLWLRYIWFKWKFGMQWVLILFL